MYISRNNIVVLSVIVLTAAAFSCRSGESVAVNLEDQVDRESYAIGINIGKNIQNQLGQQELGHDPAIVSQGIRDVLTGRDMLLNDDEVRQIILDINTRIQKKQEEAAEAAEKEREKVLLEDEAAVANKKAGEDFLEKNAQRDEVIVHPSGLQYEVLKEGSGDSIGPNATVKTHYTLILPDGKKIDSSYDRGEPFTLDLSRGGVIKGWMEAIPLMKAGSKWKLYLPYSLGYGASGNPPEIPAFQVLIFDIEIVEVQ